MLKFKYHYLTNSLFIQKLNSEPWNQISEDKQFTGNYQAQGFILEPQNHWISFKVYERNLQVFYKFPQELNGELSTVDGFWTPETITYYRKYLPKQEEVIFTFTNQDQVEKVAGKWIKKGNHE